MSQIILINGDCLERLKSLVPASVDSLCCDPPAGIGFMGKEWDHDKGGRDHWIDWMTQVMTECLRVMKPGAHGFVWAIPRTSHWTATALENAGFEIRDVVTHLFSSGFPKSHNISKAIDKAGLGDNSKQWDGWGTALKPASEHWILVRKPISEKTVVKNVLKHGTGGINIDASRVGPNPGYSYPNGPGVSNDNTYGTYKIRGPIKSTQGRFPANVILDEVAGELLDKQSGLTKSVSSKKSHNRKHNSKSIYGDGNGLGERNPFNSHSDSGGASRFFYCAKALKSERGLDNNHPTVKAQKLMEYLITMITPPNGLVLDPFMGSGSTGVAAKQLGFKFIGIEKDDNYFEIAQNRIGRVTQWKSC